jgi:hypothetical protein
MIKSYWVLEMVGIRKEKFISINLFSIHTFSLHHYKRRLKRFFSDLLPTFIDIRMGACCGMTISIWYSISIYFSDELNCHVSGCVNRHNCGIWGKENKHVNVRNGERLCQSQCRVWVNAPRCDQTLVVLWIFEHVICMRFACLITKYTDTHSGSVYLLLLHDKNS